MARFLKSLKIYIFTKTKKIQLVFSVEGINSKELQNSIKKSMYKTENNIKTLN
jgi:hypothetical protein